jgi:hypothetical protein
VVDEKVQAINNELFSVLNTYGSLWNVNTESSLLSEGRGSIENLTKPILLELVKFISNAQVSFAKNDPEYAKYLKKVVALIMPDFLECFEKVAKVQTEEPSIFDSLTSLFSNAEPKTFQQEVQKILVADPNVVTIFRRRLQRMDRDDEQLTSSVTIHSATHRQAPPPRQKKIPAPPPRVKKRASTATSTNISNTR